MVHETTSIDPADPNAFGSTAGSRGANPLAVLPLGLSVVLIALVAVGFSCLAAAASVLVLYARLGLDGLMDFYQELRFDIPLKTQLGAAAVSLVYVGVACATVAVAAWRAGRRWPALVALSPARWRRPATLLVFVVTLAYAAAATLAMSLMSEHRVIISGQTDMLLLGTIAANLVILAPLAEEMFFRGWLYTGLRHRLAFWPSFALTTCLFAAIHFDTGHRRVFLVLPLALALGVLREVTGSIKPTIALHATYNFIIVTLTLLET